MTKLNTWIHAILLALIVSCSPKSSQSNPDKRPIKTFFFKRNLNLRNAVLHMAYELNKNSVNFKIKEGYKLSFFDEFDSLDTKKWRLGQPWGEFHPDNLHQYYGKDQINVKNGCLYLSGSYKPKTFKIKDSSVVIPYAVGLINSDISFHQKYGYFEIRSKNPSGAATWPAFWLTGATRWPPEIDIFEMYGKKSGKSVHNQLTTIHWGKTNSKSRGYLSRKINLPNNTDSLFHIYACEWTPNQIKFYTDGHLTGKMNVNKRLREWLNEEMVVIINNSFEEKYLKFLPNSFSSNHFIVDWVRVYTKD
ncbi:MAG: glycoside hydrolase family 16 protein [Bacteroidia bacterium]